MLARLTGVLEEIDSGSALISCADGRAHEALLPSHLASSLAASVGRTVTLHTLEHYESQSQGASFTPRLLGFGSREERRFFELLTRVKGLGPKRALRAMAEPTPAIARAILERDARFLQGLPEIGKKLAETMIMELQDKVAGYAAEAGGGGAPTARPAGAARGGAGGLDARSPAGQAAAALVRLGEARAEAERLVARALEDHPGLDSPDALLAAALAHRGL